MIKPIIGTSLLITLCASLTCFFLIQQSNISHEKQRDQVADTLLNSFNSNMELLLAQVSHQLLRDTSMINTKEVKQSTYHNMHRMDTLPFISSIEHIRYSPLIYQDELDNYLTFANSCIYTDFSIYSQVNRLTDRELYIPFANVDPVDTFPPVFFGFDLYNFSSTKAFFDQFTTINQSITVISDEPFELGSSSSQYDKGVYIGKIITDMNCACSNASSFQELAILNNDSRCILGFTYLPMKMRGFVSNSLKEFAASSSATAHSAIVDNIEYLVTIDGNIVTVPDRFGEMIGPDNTNDIEKYYQRIRKTTIASFNTKQFNIWLLIKDADVDINDDIVQQQFIIVLITGSFWLVLLINIAIIYYFVRKASKIQETKMNEAQTMISWVNHEMRMPLSAISGFTTNNMLQLNRLLSLVNTESNCTKIIRSIISNMGTVQNSTRLLTIIVNDILDMQKLEKGKLNVRYRSCPISKIIYDSHRSLQHMIDEKSQIVDFEIISNGISGTLFTDPDRIIQILINFMTNAFKHVTSGKVCMIVDKVETGQIKISVSDTGSGIKSDVASNIFKRKFIAGSNSSNANVINGIRGVGIGLYLCKMLADLMNIDIGFTTILGHGSTFYIILPVGLTSENIPDSNV